jgi:glycerol-3-phosphate O-acyltransferase
MDKVNHNTQISPVFKNRGMTLSLNRWAHWFAQKFLDHIPYAAEDAERLTALAERGEVVYVHRARNIVSHLALSRIVQGLQIPKAHFVGGLNVKWLRKWFGVFTRRKLPSDAPKDKGHQEEWLLSSCVEQGGAAELFLRRPLTLVTGQSSYAAQYVQALVALQRTRERPIFLVPHCLVLRSRPSSIDPKPTDLIFGTAGEPGLIRASLRMIIAHKTAHWEVSESLNLKDFVDRFHHLDDDKIARKARWTLLNHMARIERVFHGPPMKSGARLKQDTLKDPALQRVMAEQAKKKNQNQKKVQRKVNRYFDEIASKFDIDVVFLMDSFLRLVWSWIYRKLVYEKSDMQMLNKASQKGSIVLVPSHRSHVDYLVFSQVLFWEGMLPPHIAAGINLAFFPLGNLLRRAGAFFIRRSFAGNVLYSTVFKAYVKRLLKEGHTQEFFIEGGRSRTGKTLPPKMGMLGMIVDAYMDSREKDLIFVPASISYDKIVESKSYIKELRGGQKETESAGALVKSVGVLKRKYGNVFVTLDQPISLNSYLEKMGLTRGLLEADDRRRLIKALAYHIVHGINCATVVTSTSLVACIFLGLRKKGIAKSELLQKTQHLLGRFKNQQDIRYRIAPELEEQFEKHIEDSLNLFIADSLVTVETVNEELFYRPKEKAYLVLDYYKNSIIHLLVSDAMLAASYLACAYKQSEGVTKEALKAQVKSLSILFKIEFIFPTDKPFDTLFNEAYERCLSKGWLQEDKGLADLSSHTGHQKEFLFTAMMLMPFIEAYLAVCQKVIDFEGKSETQKAMLRILMEGLQASYLAGTLICYETQNEATLKNAFLALGEMGILKSAKNKPKLHEDGKEQLLEITEMLKICHLSIRKSLTP